MAFFVVLGTHFAPAPILSSLASTTPHHSLVPFFSTFTAAIRIAALPAEYEDRVWMRAMAATMNRRHVMAQLAGRASVTLHTHLFFKVRVHVRVMVVCVWCVSGVCLVCVSGVCLVCVRLGAGN